MKKALFLLGVILTTLTFGTSSSAQGPVQCVETLNSFFHEEVVTTMPQGASPKILNRLGTNPQFGRIRRFTSESAYAHFKSVNRRGKRQAKELDRLLMTLGYTGVNDPTFTAQDIEPVIVPKGSVGWMGSGSTKYFKAEFGKDFEGFKIFVKDGPCFVYIMRLCGNIFYVDSPACDESYPCPECLNAQSFTGTVNPFCNCTPCPECQETQQQTLNLSGDGNIQSGDCVMGEKEVELVAEFEGETICLGSMSVPVNVSYEYAASGSTSATEIVEVDNQDGNAMASESLKIPVNLDFDIAESQTSFGDNGMIKMMVTEKRFKALKKMYPACPEKTAMATEGLMAPSVDAGGETMTNPAGDGKAGLKKQTLHFAGSDAISEVASKEHNPIITVVAHSTKTGKLVNGESAERYLCLGQYSVPGSSALAYTLTGNSMLTKSLEICDKDGNEPADKYIDLPIELSASFTKQEMKAGNDGKVVVEVTEAQYKKLAKRFSRCCSNGDESCY